jgi:hypothetical protein
MSQSPMTRAEHLEALSRKLQQLHSQLLQAQRELHPPVGGRELLDRLFSDPAWTWLRPLSALIADIDHVLAQPDAPTVHDQAVVAAHLRGLLAGEGDLLNEQFLERYRPLLQLHADLACTHGELKGSLKTMPAEPEDEGDRLHARHQWNMRCKHRQ